MKVRGDSIASLERAIRDARERIEQGEAQRGQHQGLAAQAEHEKRSVADDPAAFNEAAQKARHHLDEAERLGIVLERRTVEVAELERRLELARYESARDTLESSLVRQHDASKKFAAAIVSAGKAAAGMLAARDEVDAATTRARELCPAALDFEPPGPDEPEWADVDRLIVTLQAGPRRPLAKTDAAIEQIRRQGEQTVRTHAFQAAREAIVSGDFERLGRISPEERRAAVEAAEGLARSMPTSERAAEVAQRRLERIRELVDASDQVETAA